MDQLEKIIRENCWKFDKGYPDSQEDIDYLKTLIEQEFTSTSTAGDNVEVTYDNIEDVPVEEIKPPRRSRKQLAGLAYILGVDDA